jgi:hypothetical protein
MEFFYWIIIDFLPELFMRDYSCFLPLPYMHVTCLVFMIGKHVLRNTQIVHSSLLF